jgi:hypothetical protein
MLRLLYRPSNPLTSLDKDNSQMKHRVYLHTKCYIKNNKNEHTVIGRFNYTLDKSNKVVNILSNSNVTKYYAQALI